MFYFQSGGRKYSLLSHGFKATDVSKIQELYSTKNGFADIKKLIKSKKQKCTAQYERLQYMPTTLNFQRDSYSPIC